MLLTDLCLNIEVHIVGRSWRNSGDINVFPLLLRSRLFHFPGVSLLLTMDCPAAPIGDDIQNNQRHFRFPWGLRRLRAFFHRVNPGPEKNGDPWKKRSPIPNRSRRENSRVHTFSGNQEACNPPKSDNDYHMNFVCGSRVGHFVVTTVRAVHLNSFGLD